MKHTFKDKMMAQLHSSCPPHIDSSFEKYIKYLQKNQLPSLWLLLSGMLANIFVCFNCVEYMYGTKNVKSVEKKRSVIYVFEFIEPDEYDCL